MTRRTEPPKPDASLLQPNADTPTVTVDGQTAGAIGSGTHPTREEVEARRISVGDTIDRFRVVAQLGAGGMGVVYRCHDPKLDRAVAVKLIRPGRSGEYRQYGARLMREAKAAAKLSHPNVISVYEVGADEAGPFIAMELVDGLNVSDWLAAEARTWQQVLDVYLQAGRGLAAAHEAGLVHRDVKPDNIFVGEDRVRIGDFGIAQESIASSADAATAVVSDAELRLTRTGTTLGTPRYMAPEQKARGGSDQRSDQYSFCVSVFEGIFGRQPDEPAAAGEPSVPRWLSEALARGMAEQPEERFDSMAELLVALDRLRARRNRVAVVAGLAAVGMAGVALFALSRSAETSPDVCKTAGVEFDSVWNDVARQQVKQAFLASGRGYAGASFRSVDDQLTKHGGVWASEKTKLCHEQKVNAAATSVLRANRARCLGRQLERTRLMVVALKRADKRLVDRGFTLGSKLGDAACANTTSLAQQPARPDDAEKQKRIHALETRIDGLTVTFYAGKHRKMSKDLQTLVVDAKALGYAPALAEALLLQLRTQIIGHDYKSAVKTGRELIAAASAAKNDNMLAQAWINLIQATERSRQPKKALEMKHAAESAVLRAGNGPRLQARLAQLLGNLYRDVGQPEQSRHHLRRALELAERHFPNTNVHSVALTNLAIAEQRGGSLDRGIAMLERANAIQIKQYSKHHPRMLEIYGNLASMMSAKGKLERANELFHDMLTTIRKVFGAKHPYIPLVLDYLAKNALKANKFGDARKYAADSLAARLKPFGAKSPQLADSYMVRGQIALAEGTPAAAVADCKTSSELYDKRPNNPVRVDALTCYGESLVKTGASAKAVEPLRTATEQAVRLKLAPRRVWRANVWLARAMWETKRDRPRAKALLAKWLRHAPADRRKVWQATLDRWAK